MLALLLTAGLAGWLGPMVWQTGLDIQLHDVFLVISNRELLTTLFGLLLFLIFFGKQFFHKTNSRFTYWLLVLVGLILFYQVINLLVVLTSFLAQPSLIIGHPNLAQSSPSELGRLTRLHYAPYLLFGLGFILLIALLISTYRWGRQTRLAHSRPPSEIGRS
ncbi:MAG: hypothetical protein MUC97_00345 [Bernardetiaceae bacterium]|nr:hypothetical protein [Bernardetiaceae bacterium]